MQDEITIPSLPNCEPWSKLEALGKEKEVIGFYISGHPLDDYRFELQHFCNVTAERLAHDLNRYRNREVCFAGIITEANHRMSKTGKPFGNFTVEDLSGNFQITLFGEERQVQAVFEYGKHHIY